ncbi:MAG: sulfur carrier protein ThiS [Deltaproteobacteria bacterium]|nr:sulfur carrier protein ThiS [Deltaproteobacteria bacterium]
MPQTITITVDGLAEPVPEDLGLPQLIERHQAQHKDLIVEINGRFVNPRDYAQVSLAEGDRVELIHPAFGG